MDQAASSAGGTSADSTSYQSSANSTLTTKVTLPSHVIPGGGPSPVPSGLDLRTNDNAFHVIAQVVVDKYDDHVTAKSLTVTAEDRLQLDRMVPPHVRGSFIEALRFRLKTCPRDSSSPIHVLTRNCQSLGMDRVAADQNLLLAPPGTVIPINVSRYSGLCFFSR